ncbi:DNA polymerase V [Spirosoma lacussanchae]|uniref:LexA family protein n=1 Tax=Spirosoma lacussanchae TaxID=1884249 RepID=UPI003D1D5979
MIVPDDRIPVHDIVKATVQTTFFIPFYSYYVNAGFASPAESYIEKACDLNELCIDNEEATYFVRVGSDSMSGDRIERGDVLVVDCSKEPSDGKIVVVWYNGDHAVKRIYHVEQMVVLLSSNPKYDPIYVHPGEDFSVFGVVVHVFFKPLVRPSLHDKHLISDATALGQKNKGKKPSVK